MVSKLEKSAKIAIEVCMGVKPNEKVLIITDTPTEEVGNALFKASERITETMMMKIPPTGENGREPPKVVAYAMKNFDVVLAPTKYSLTHTKARKNACKAGARVVTLPGITKDIFERTIDIDYKKMKKTIKKLAEILDKGSKVKIKTDSGTDVILDISDRRTEKDDGLFIKPRMYGNLPAGEVCMAPRETKTKGVIVIDKMGNYCKPKTKVFIRNGRAQEVEGDVKFKKELWKYKNARYIGELGIGTNPKAIVSGVVLEDEKVLGTCHLAFGSSFSFPGGRIKADIHWDGILFRPTIWLDDKKIMDGGELLI